MHAMPSCHVPVASHVCTTCPLHCFAFGAHVPEHAPPLQRLVQAEALNQVPLASHVSGVRPSQRRVVGAQTPVQAPSTHKKGQLATGVVLTRSMPHVTRSAPSQIMVSADFESQPGTTGWQDPALLPGVVSQLLRPEHVPLACHEPPTQTSCPFCAWPAQAYAPINEHDCPITPTAVPSPALPSAPLGTIPPSPPLLVDESFSVATPPVLLATPPAPLAPPPSIDLPPLGIPPVPGILSLPPEFT